MPTLFAVYNLKKDQRSEDYDGYLTKTKANGETSLGTTIASYGES